MNNQQDFQLVQMPFHRNGPRKRISRALSKKRRELTKLKTDYQDLQRKYKTTLRRLQRMRKTEVPNQANTSRSKTNAKLREAGLDGERVNKIRKQMLLSNAIIEVKLAKSKNKPGKASILRNIVVGRILKKYRFVSALSMRLKLDRNRVGKVKTKSISFSKQKRVSEVRRYRDAVVTFMERDDNSRMLPKKTDKVKTGVNESTQTRVLTDYLSNLHTKLLSENPTVELSLASSQRIRPKHIRTTSFITRDNCLCTKHQNMALLLKSLRQEGMTVPTNPEVFIECHNLESIDREITKEEVSFDE